MIVLSRNGVRTQFRSICQSRNQCESIFAFLGANSLTRQNGLYRIPKSTEIIKYPTTPSRQLPIVLTQFASKVARYFAQQN